MKKSTFLATVFALAAMTAQADEKIIYQDNFTDEATTMANWSTNRDWTSTGSSFVSTPDGNYIQFGNGTANYNGTRFSTIWGETPWEGVTLPENAYSMKFSFNFAQFGNNSSNAAQRNNEIAVISAGESSNSLSSYWGTCADTHPGYLFKLTQSPGEGGIATAVNGTCYFIINNETDSVNVSANTWYNVTLYVTGSTVEYDIEDISGTPLTSGSYTLPEGADNRAGGILHYQARYMGISQFMNIKVAYDSDEDVANPPVVSLNRVRGNDRIYRISFAEGETLHYVLPGESEKVVDYWDAEDSNGNPGNATVTVTQSGQLRAWTTKNDAVSEVIVVEVEAGVIKLVDPVAKIISVEEGYGKTYQITVDNSAVVLVPQIFLDVTFTPDGAGTAFHDDNFANGGTVKLDSKGTLKVVASTILRADGTRDYESSEVTIQNDREYKILHDIDFEHMDAANIQSRGFTASASNVNDQWNTRGRLFYTLIKGTEVGDTVKVYPFGATLDDNKFTEWEMLGSTVDSLVAHTVFAPVYVWYDTVNLHMKEGVGLISPGRKGDANDGNWVQNATVGVDGLTDDDFIFVGKIGSYGTSYNPVYVNMTEEEATALYMAEHKYSTTEVYPGTETFLLYRVDTSLARVVVFRSGDASGIREIGTGVVSDSNAPIYTLNGVRVNATSLRPGIYVKQGRKFIVR